MNKDLFNNTKIRVTPEQSERVQKLAFECGVSWRGSGNKVMKIYEPYLYFSGKYISHGGSEYYFDRDSYREIFMSDLFPSEKIGLLSEAKEEATRRVKGTGGQDDLSKWSIADLWAAEQFCRNFMSKYQFALEREKQWRRQIAKFETELLKRLQP